MRFRIGDRELELELLTFRLRRLHKPRPQLNQPEEDQGAQERSEDILEVTL